MDYLKAINKMLSNWNGAVWGNLYEGIKPDVSETRPIPSLAELEAVWPQIEAERIAAEHNNKIIAELAVLDLKSIRALRDGDAEYVEMYKIEAQSLRGQLK